MKSSLSIAILEIFLGREFLLALKKTRLPETTEPCCRSRLPILRYDCATIVKEMPRMKIILITTATGIWGKNGIRRGRQH
jgi:hypothetical protein